MFRSKPLREGRLPLLQYGGREYRGECNTVVDIRGWKLSERYKERRKSNGRALSQLHPPLDSCKQGAASSFVMPIPSASLCYKKKKCDLQTLIVKHHLPSFNNRRSCSLVVLKQCCAALSRVCYWGPGRNRPVKDSCGTMRSKPSYATPRSGRKSLPRGGWPRAVVLLVSLTASSLRATSTTSTY